MKLSGHKYNAEKKLTDAIDPQRVFYDVEERDSGEAPKKVGTAELPPTQANRENAKQLIERWCALYPKKLPLDGGTFKPDLNEVERLTDKR
jgi:hypothetical protein